MILLMMAPPLEGCYCMMLCMPMVDTTYHRPSPSSAGGGHRDFYFPAAATSTAEIDGLTIQGIKIVIISTCLSKSPYCRSDSQQQGG
jgi:hypothetical protein